MIPEVLRLNVLLKGLPVGILQMTGIRISDSRCLQIIRENEEICEKEFPMIERLTVPPSPVHHLLEEHVLVISERRAIYVSFAGNIRATYISEMYPMTCSRRGGRSFWIMTQRISRLIW